MTIDKRVHRLLGSGVYADVFQVNGRAHKLFKSGPEIPPRQTKERRKRVFECQCAALRRASGDSWLKEHIVTFYGTRVIEDVLDPCGSSGKDDYLLDCCCVLQLIDPDEVAFKLTTEGVRENNDHIRRAVSLFTRLGIAVLDSSVYYFTDEEQFKFIDIEMEYC
jgi:hypothetical protein